MSRSVTLDDTHTRSADKHVNTTAGMRHGAIHSLMNANTQVRYCVHVSYLLMHRTYVEGQHAALAASAMLPAGQMPVAGVGAVCDRTAYAAHAMSK